MRRKAERNGDMRPSTLPACPAAAFIVLCILLLALSLGCGRRGDPFPVLPYRDVPPVSDLEALQENETVLLTWSAPEEDDFPRKALKGFVIFRADIPEGKELEGCDCEYRLLDFIKTDSPESRRSQSRFEYSDKKLDIKKSYVYKVGVMDRMNKISRDSNLVVFKGARTEPEQRASYPSAPTKLVGLYTQESVVLTWKEVRDGGVKAYRIYRSEGNGFTLVGEVLTPAFTDKNVVPSKIYLYKVTAVGDNEGLPSGAIEITTETR